MHPNHAACGGNQGCLDAAPRRLTVPRHDGDRAIEALRGRVPDLRHRLRARTAAIVAAGEWGLDPRPIAVHLRQALRACVRAGRRGDAARSPGAPSAGHPSIRDARLRASGSRGGAAPRRRGRRRRPTERAVRRAGCAGWARDGHGDCEPAGDPRGLAARSSATSSRRSNSSTPTRARRPGASWSPTWCSARTLRMIGGRCGCRARVRRERTDG